MTMAAVGAVSLAAIAVYVAVSAAMGAAEISAAVNFLLHKKDNGTS